MGRILFLATLILLAVPAANLAIADDVENALVTFSEAGDLDKVSYLVITKGGNANSRDVFGRVALIEAAKGGHLPVVKFLVEHGADVNARGSMGYTPLMKAIDAGHLEIVKYLGSKGADLGLRDSYGHLPIDLAEKGPNRAVYNYLRQVHARSELRDELRENAAKGNLSKVKQIIRAGISVNEQSERGITALMSAASWGKINVVKWLIENNADPNVVANNGYTALYVAVEYRYIKVVEYLLDNGALVQPDNKRARSTIDMARVSGDKAIFKLIEGRKEREDTEKRLTRDIKVASGIIDTYRLRKPGHLTDDEGAVVISAINQLVSLKTEWIKKLGDDSFESKVYLQPLCLDSRLINRNTDYIPPLTFSAGSGSPAGIMSTISKGVDVNESNGIGETALILVAKTHFIDPHDERTPNQRTQDYVLSMELLLKAGAYINSVDIAGWTALMWASFNGDKHLVKLLIEKGADPKIASKSGASALSIAESLGYENTAAIIKAKPN